MVTTGADPFTPESAIENSSINIVIGATALVLLRMWAFFRL
jgi:hypothetical protein